MALRYVEVSPYKLDPNRDVWEGIVRGNRRMRTRKITRGLVVVLLLAAGLLAACAEPTPTLPERTQPIALPTATPQRQEGQPSSFPTAAPEGQTVAPPAPVSSWQADGVVADGEYAHQAAIGDVTLWWRNDAQFLYLAMEAQTTGWVAVGLDPTNRMEGANFIFGAVVGGEARIWDAYGTAPIGPNHPPDEDLGGTNDIVAYAGVEEGGVTRFEAQIPLDSGDDFDKPLQSGNTYSVITALGASDDFNARHSSRASGEIMLD